MNYLHTVKLASCNIGDMALVDVLKVTQAIEHLEVTKCERITEFSINKVLELCPNIKFLDVNGIPVVSYAMLDEIMKAHPQLLMKRHKYQDQDFKKDNGLRIPRLLPAKKKPKGKGKKKK
jgi:hypothetical protein